MRSCLIVLAALATVLGLVAEAHDHGPRHSHVRGLSGEDVPSPCKADEVACPGDPTTCVKDEKLCESKVQKCDSAKGCEPPIPKETTEKCTNENCKLPDCACPLVESEKGDDLFPGGLKRNETPQMVLVTMSGGVTPEIFKVIDALFDSGDSGVDLINPNGCLAKSTIFVNNEVTDYSLVSYLFNDGHEIGVNGVSGRPDHSHWKNLKPEQLRLELHGMRHLLNMHANISEEEIRGVRVPTLGYNGNTLFEVVSSKLNNSSSPFTYDSSISVPLRGEQAWWPFTLDYPTGDCESDNECPTRPFKGTWEIPLNTIDSSEENCIALDSCGHDLLGDEDLMYEFLMKAFLRHYNTNRAPFHLVLRPSNLIAYPAAMRGLIQFLANILSSEEGRNEDVYLVRASDAIEWMKRPTKVGKDLENFGPWMKRCRRSSSRSIKMDTFCSVSICRFPLGRDSIYRSYCGTCPESFPRVLDLKASRFHDEQ